MSNYRSDKCTKQEVQDFKKEVLAWLTEKDFSIKGKKIKSFTCYNGDVRIYTGVMEIPNSKESFRRTEPEKDDKGNIIGWHGTRGKHTSRRAEYISINRDEWEEVKKAFENKDDFWEEYLFRHLRG